MKKYIIYGKVKNTIYSIVNRGLDEAKQRAQTLTNIIKGEEFYIVESAENHTTLSWDKNVEEFLKGAIRVN